jgi:methyl-accepting chemotaxis protein
MDSAFKASASKGIERFVTLAIGLLVAASAGAAILTGAMARSDEAERSVENARDARTSSDLTRLIVLQKQIVLDVVQVQQFLTDVSATRGLSGLDDGWGEADKNAQAFAADTAEARALALKLNSPEMVTALDRAAAKFPDYYQVGQTMAHGYVDKGPEAGNLLMPNFDAASEALAAQLDATSAALADTRKMIDARDAKAEAGFAMRQRTLVGVNALAAVISVLGGLAVLFLARRKVLSPLAKLSDYMGRLADGDYEQAVPVRASRDELGAMARSVVVFREAAMERRASREQREAERALSDEEKAARDAQAAKADAERAMVVRAVAEGLSRLAAGDLTHRIRQPFAGDYEQLRVDFNGAADTLAETLARIRDASNGVHGGAEEIAHATDDMSRRTEHQAARLEETAAALDEITATVRQTAEASRQAQAVMNEAEVTGRSTGTLVSAAVAAVGEIETSSSRIASIIDVINEIAFQTNLLALNAGVEAARAGEAGRGFAVVAQEVRALAQRSSSAASEIKALVNTASEKVGEGVGLVRQTGGALETMVHQIHDIAALVTAISASAQEQSSALNQVNSAVNQMDQTTQQNAAMVEQTSAASHGLRGESTTLADLVGRFTLGQEAARRRAA